MSHLEQGQAPGAPKFRYVQETPVWVFVVRIVQFVIALLILILAALFMGNLTIDQPAFAIAAAVFSWLGIVYVLVTEKVLALRAGYSIWAVLAIDFLLCLFWLASMGANAALRGSFVTAGNGDGSNGRINATQAGLSMVSAVAGISALEMLLFLATLIYHGHTFRLWHDENKRVTGGATVELKAQGDPMLGQQPAPVPVQYTGQPQYPQQPQQPQQYQYPPQDQPQTSPYQQPTAYADPNQVQYAQQPYNPTGTPVQTPPYYPPAQQ